jgi:general secretion pathway protein E
LCPHCKEETELDEPAWQELVRPWKAPGPKMTFKPVGCLECRNTGYHGRVGLYEMLQFTDALKDLISSDCELPVLRKQGMKDGMRTLRLAGAQKVAAGVTTIEEVTASSSGI